MLDYDNKNKIYICHFPGNTRILQEQVKKEIKGSFSVDPKISIVCAFNNSCFGHDNLLNSISSSNDILFDEDILAEEWKMENKINSLVKSLRRCRTEYALVTDVRDVLITANIDEEFINKFKGMDCDIVYNATTSKYPKVNLPSDYLIEGGSGPFKYLNAGVCFGKTDKLLEWYEHCNVLFENNKSEQFVLRKLYNPSFKIKIDGERKLFRSCHAYDTIFFKDRKNLYLSYTKDAYIEIDKKLRYKRLLPNGKIQKGKIEIEEFNEKRIFIETELKFINVPSPVENITNDLFNELNKLFKTKLKTLIINYKDDEFNYETYARLLPTLKIIDRLVINVYNSNGLDFLLSKINNCEFNCINKIIFNMYINDKTINFPFDERIVVKYISNDKDQGTKTYKIIDKKHSGYYKIKLNDDELKNLKLEETNGLISLGNYIKQSMDPVSGRLSSSQYSQNYWINIDKKYNFCII